MGGFSLVPFGPTVAEGKNRKKCASVSLPPRRKEGDMIYQITPFTVWPLAENDERVQSGLVMTGHGYQSQSAFASNELHTEDTVPSSGNMATPTARMLPP